MRLRTITYIPNVDYCVNVDILTTSTTETIEMKDTSFKVFATCISAISGAQIKFQLVERHDGFCFQNLETLAYEQGTFVISGENKLKALDLFRSIYQQMNPTFILE